MPRAGGETLGFSEENDCRGAVYCAVVGSILSVLRIYMSGVDRSDDRAERCDLRTDIAGRFRAAASATV